jgi:hypothetical protein
MSVAKVLLQLQAQMVQVVGMAEALEAIGLVADHCLQQVVVELLTFASVELR